MNVLDLLRDGNHKCEQIEFKELPEPDLIPEPGCLKYEGKRYFTVKLFYIFIIIIIDNYTACHLIATIDKK